MRGILLIPSILLLLPNRIKNLLSIRNPSRHFVLLRIQHIRQCLVVDFSLLWSKKNGLFLSLQKNLAVVKEVHLEKFVTQAEHYRVTGLQPLLHVHELVEWLENYLALYCLWNHLLRPFLPVSRLNEWWTYQAAGTFSGSPFLLEYFPECTLPFSRPLTSDSSRNRFAFDNKENYSFF